MCAKPSPKNDASATEIQPWVVYKPGTQMFVADHLSRAFLKDTGTEDEEFQVFVLELEAFFKMACSLWHTNISDLQVGAWHNSCRRPVVSLSHATKSYHVTNCPFCGEILSAKTFHWDSWLFWTNWLWSLKTSVRRAIMGRGHLVVLFCQSYIYHCCC